MSATAILEVGKYEGQWVVLRDSHLVTVGHGTEAAAKQAARRTVNCLPGYRFVWRRGPYSYAKVPEGVSVAAYHVYAGVQR